MDTLSLQVVVVFLQMKVHIQMVVEQIQIPAFTVPSSYSSTPYTFTVSVQEGDSGGEVASDTITIGLSSAGCRCDEIHRCINK